MKSAIVNYHITEYCNYSCKFCFAKYGLEDCFSDELHNDLAQVRAVLEQVLRNFGGPGNVRINFVGGEPLLVKSFPQIIDLAFDMGFEVSIVTNGSALTESFLKHSAAKMSMIGVSIDSFHDQRNIGIGRVTRSGKPFDAAKTLEMISLARSINPELFIKINTVVSEVNWTENMSSWINRFAPDKWKVFRVLPEGEKRELLINDGQFSAFVSANAAFVDSKVYVEDNDAMTESYIMIDPLGRFMQNSGLNGARVFSAPILEQGVSSAFSQISFSKMKYDDRYIPIKNLGVVSDVPIQSHQELYAQAV